MSTCANNYILTTDTNGNKFCYADLCKADNYVTDCKCPIINNYSYIDGKESNC